MKKTVNSTSELARHLGLSRWAVSRAINGQSGVSDATVAAVKAAMLEFGFTPSIHGRGLQGGRTGTIGVCFRALDTPITIQKLAHFQRSVSTRGYRPLFELTELDQRMGTDVINHFIALRVEGVLLVDTPAGESCTAWMKMLAQHKIPVALLEPLGPAGFNAVHLDREQATAQVTQHLLELGHRRFALLGIGREFPMGRPRYDGIARALAAGGLDLDRCAVVLNLPHTRPAGLRYGNALAEALLDLQTPLPTALLAVNDEVAAGVMWRLQRAGYRMPRDLSIFGFDNLALSEQTTPSLCTVDHQVEAMAEATVALLFQVMAEGPGAKVPTLKTPPKLIIRDSVGPAGSTQLKRHLSRKRSPATPS